MSLGFLKFLISATGQLINPTNFSEFFMNFFGAVGNFFGVLWNGVCGVFYIPCKWLLAFTDFLQYFIQKLIGLDYWLNNSVYSLSGATSSDLLFSFLYNDTIQRVFNTMVVVFVVLLIIFTIYAIIRSEWQYITGDQFGSGSNSKMGILRSSMKAIALVLIFPLVLTIGIISSNAILASLVKALNIDMSSTFGGSLFLIGSKNANKYRVYAKSGEREPITDIVTFYVKNHKVIRLGTTKTENDYYIQYKVYDEYLAAINEDGVEVYSVNAIFDQIDIKDNFSGYCIRMDIDDQPYYYMVKCSETNKEAMYYYLRNILQVDIMYQNHDAGSSDIYKEIGARSFSTLTSCRGYISNKSFNSSSLESLWHAFWNTWGYASVYNTTHSFENSLGYSVLNLGDPGSYYFNSSSSLLQNLGLTSINAVKLLYNGDIVSQYFDGGQFGLVQLQNEYYVMADVVDFMNNNDITLYMIDMTSPTIDWNYADYTVDTRWIATDATAGSITPLYTPDGKNGELSNSLPFIVSYTDEVSDIESGNILYMAKKGMSDESFGSKYIMCWKVIDGTSTKYVPLVNGKEFKDSITGNGYTFSSSYLSSNYRGVVLAKGVFSNAGWFSSNTGNVNAINGSPTYIKSDAVSKAGAKISTESPYYYYMDITGKMVEYAGYDPLGTNFVSDAYQNQYQGALTNIDIEDKYSANISSILMQNNYNLQNLSLDFEKLLSSLNENFDFNATSIKDFDTVNYLGIDYEVVEDSAFGTWAFEYTEGTTDPDDKLVADARIFDALMRNLTFTVANSSGEKIAVFDSYSEKNGEACYTYSIQVNSNYKHYIDVYRHTVVGTSEDGVTTFNEKYQFEFDTSRISGGKLTFKPNITANVSGRVVSLTEGGKNSFEISEALAKLLTLNFTYDNLSGTAYYFSTNTTVPGQIDSYTYAGTLSNSQTFFITLSKSGNNLVLPDSNIANRNFSVQNNVVKVDYISQADCANGNMTVQQVAATLEEVQRYASIVASVNGIDYAVTYRSNAMPDFAGGASTGDFYVDIDGYRYYLNLTLETSGEVKATTADSKVIITQTGADGTEKIVSGGAAIDAGGNNSFAIQKVSNNSGVYEKITISYDYLKNLKYVKINAGKDANSIENGLEAQFSGVGSNGGIEFTFAATGGNAYFYLGFSGRELYAMDFDSDKSLYVRGETLEINNILTISVVNGQDFGDKFLGNSTGTSLTIQTVNLDSTVSGYEVVRVEKSKDTPYENKWYIATKNSENQTIAATLSETFIQSLSLSFLYNANGSSLNMSATYAGQTAGDNYLFSTIYSGVTYYLTVKDNRDNTFSICTYTTDGDRFVANEDSDEIVVQTRQYSLYYDYSGNGQTGEDAVKIAVLTPNEFTYSSRKDGYYMFTTSDKQIVRSGKYEYINIYFDTNGNGSSLLTINSNNQLNFAKPIKKTDENTSYMYHADEYTFQLYNYFVGSYGGSTTTSTQVVTNASENISMSDAVTVSTGSWANRVHIYDADGKQTATTTSGYVGAGDHYKVSGLLNAIYSLSKNKTDNFRIKIGNSEATYTGITTNKGYINENGKNCERKIYQFEKDGSVYYFFVEFNYDDNEITIYDATGKKITGSGSYTYLRQPTYEISVVKTSTDNPSSSEKLAIYNVNNKGDKVGTALSGNTLKVTPSDLSYAYESNGVSYFETKNQYSVDELGTTKLYVQLSPSSANADAKTLINFKEVSVESGGNTNTYKNSLESYAVNPTTSGTTKTNVGLYEYKLEEDKVDLAEASDEEGWSFTILVDSNFSWASMSNSYGLYNGRNYIATIYKSLGVPVNSPDEIQTKSLQILYDYKTYYNISTQNTYASKEEFIQHYEEISDSMVVSFYRINSQNNTLSSSFKILWLLNFRVKFSFCSLKMNRGYFDGTDTSRSDQTWNGSNVYRGYEGAASFKLSDGINFDYFFDTKDVDLSTFYIQSKISYWIIVISSVLIIKTLMTALWGIIKRFYEITLYFLAMPAVASTIPLDNGNKFNSGIQQPLIKKVLSTYGVILGINVFFILLSPVKSLSQVFTEEDIKTSGTYFLKYLPISASMLNDYVYILFVLVAFTMIDTLPGVISGLVGGDDVKKSGQETKQQVGQSLSSAANFVSGKDALGAAKNVVSTAANFIPGSQLIAAPVKKIGGLVNSGIESFGRGFGSGYGESQNNNNNNNNGENNDTNRENQDFDEDGNPIPPQNGSDGTSPDGTPPGGGSDSNRSDDGVNDESPQEMENATPAVREAAEIEDQNQDEDESDVAVVENAGVVKNAGKVEGAGNVSEAQTTEQTEEVKESENVETSETTEETESVENAETNAPNEADVEAEQKETKEQLEALQQVVQEYNEAFEQYKLENEIKTKEDLQTDIDALDDQAIAKRGTADAIDNLFSGRELDDAMQTLSQGGDLRPDQREAIFQLVRQRDNGIGDEQRTAVASLISNSKGDYKEGDARRQSDLQALQMLSDLRGNLRSEADGLDEQAYALVDQQESAKSEREVYNEFDQTEAGKQLAEKFENIGAEQPSKDNGEAQPENAEGEEAKAEGEEEKTDGSEVPATTEEASVPVVQEPKQNAVAKFVGKGMKMLGGRLKTGVFDLGQRFKKFAGNALDLVGVTPLLKGIKNTFSLNNPDGTRKNILQFAGGILASPLKLVKGTVKHITEIPKKTLTTLKSAGSVLAGLDVMHIAAGYTDGTRARAAKQGKELYTGIQYAGKGIMWTGAKVKQGAKWVDTKVKEGAKWVATNTKVGRATVEFGKKVAAGASYVATTAKRYGRVAKDTFGYLTTAMTKEDFALQTQKLKRDWRVARFNARNRANKKEESRLNKNEGRNLSEIFNNVKDGANLSQEQIANIEKELEGSKSGKQVSDDVKKQIMEIAEKVAKQHENKDGNKKPRSVDAIDKDIEKENALFNNKDALIKAINDTEKKSVAAENKKVEEAEKQAQQKIDALLKRKARIESGQESGNLQALDAQLFAAEESGKKLVANARNEANKRIKKIQEEAASIREGVTNNKDSSAYRNFMKAHENRLGVLNSERASVLIGKVEKGDEARVNLTEKKVQNDAVGAHIMNGTIDQITVKPVHASSGTATSGKKEVKGATYVVKPATSETAPAPASSTAQSSEQQTTTSKPKVKKKTENAPAGTKPSEKAETVVAAVAEVEGTPAPKSKKGGKKGSADLDDKTKMQIQKLVKEAIKNEDFKKHAVEKVLKELGYDGSKMPLSDSDIDRILRRNKPAFDRAVFDMMRKGGPNGPFGRRPFDSQGAMMTRQEKQRLEQELRAITESVKRTSMLSKTINDLQRRQIERCLENVRTLKGSEKLVRRLEKAIFEDVGKKVKKVEGRQEDLERKLKKFADDNQNKAS